MQYFWLILLVVIVISEFLTKDLFERIFMVVYYALGLLIAVHTDAFGWKIAFIFVAGSICCADKGKMLTPSHVVAYTIILGMVLYTITDKLGGFGAGVASIVTTLFSLCVLISAKKSRSAEE